MALIITAVVIFLIMIGLTGYSGYKFNQKTSGKKGYLFVLLSPLVFVMLLFGMFAQVGANEVGIIYDELNGGVLQETYDQGLHMKSPFRHVTTIKTTNRTAYVEVYSQTEDSIYAKFEITVIYRIERQNAGLFYRTTGSVDISSEQLNSIVKKNLQSITTQYNIFDIMGLSLEEVRQSFRDSLDMDLTEIYHITLVSVSIDDVDAGQEIEQIIQDKAKAIQQIEITQREQERAIIEAQTKLIQAENQAAIDITLSQGKAEAQQLLNSVAVTAIQTMYNAQFDDETEKIEFEANATGGFLTIQEVAEIVVKQLYYDVWDGKLPTVVTDGSGIIIQP